MEIGIIYSKKDSNQRHKVTIIKKAVKNLGLSATIVEGDRVVSQPQLVVNGFDVSGALERPKKDSNNIYDTIVQILEKSAWNAMW
jgi:hypothetical protein